MVDVKTGFESKTMRQVMENWLYTKHLDIRVDASLELRSRFRKAFKMPNWMKDLPKDYADD